jgi:hypothetical protein
MLLCFRLALLLGIPDPIGFYESLPARILTAWEAYDRVEGLPNPWLQTGITTAAVCNHLRSSNSRPVRPRDYMPIRPPARRQSNRDMMAALKATAPRTSTDRV